MANTVSLTRYTVGEDAYRQLPTAAQSLGSRLFVVGGHTALAAALPRLQAALAGSKLVIAGVQWYGGECTHSNMQACASAAKQAGAQVIVGIGGGKALDTAKGAADLLGVPVFTLPTIAATCAATTALSVVYDEAHKFIEFTFFAAPPDHTFIDTAVIAAAPVKYLRAGIGDTLAKHYECTFASRNDNLDHSSGMAVNLSRMCKDPLLQAGVQALKDCEAGMPSDALRQAVLANVVTTGYVSCLVAEQYNGAVAHSLFYGLTILPGFEKNYLHGDVVAYGILVQLALDQNESELVLLRDFLLSIGIPTCLADIGTLYEERVLAPVLAETLTMPDMRHLPYEVTTEMLWQAIGVVEALKSHK